MKDHDQAESARRLKDYADKCDRQPVEITHDAKEMAPIAHVVNGFFRQPKPRNNFVDLSDNQD